MAASDALTFVRLSIEMFDEDFINDRTKAIIMMLEFPFSVVKMSYWTKDIKTEDD